MPRLPVLGIDQPLPKLNDEGCALGARVPSGVWVLVHSIQQDWARIGTDGSSSQRRCIAAQSGGCSVGGLYLLKQVQWQHATVEGEAATGQGK